MFQNQEMSTYKYKNHSADTPVDLTMEIIGGKWKIQVIWNLRQGTLRYNELKKLLPNVTHKMLAHSLKELEKDGMVKRKVYPVIPPRVEYSLTPKGLELVPITEIIAKWGMNYFVKTEPVVKKTDDMPTVKLTEQPGLFDMIEAAR